MNILFVDHVCHKKTRSADFFLEILRARHTVDCHYYDAYYDCRIPQDKIAAADLIIFWEFLPGRFKIAVNGKPCLFVPMYDNEWGSKWQWRRIARSGMSVLSFCDALTRHAISCGVKNILTVHYAMDPSSFPQTTGDPRKALYWDRGNFEESTIRALFEPDALDELVVQREFLPPEEYAAFLDRFGVYIAPRAKEGIGMAFLEQIARGKCVVSHDDATMNEYIADGQTGIIRNFNAPQKRISAAVIQAIRDKVRGYADKLYARWRQEQGDILPFCEAAAKLPPVQYGDPIDALRYVAFLAEGILMRLFK